MACGAGVGLVQVQTILVRFVVALTDWLHATLLISAEEDCFGVGGPVIIVTVADGAD